MRKVFVSFPGFQEFPASPCMCAKSKGLNLRQQLSEYADGLLLGERLGVGQFCLLPLY